MLLSAVSVLVVAQSSSEIPEGLTNNPVYSYLASKTAGLVTFFQFIFETFRTASCSRGEGFPYRGKAAGTAGACH